MIPADGRLVQSINLKIREDMLTGESDDVRKNENIIVSMEKLDVKGKEILQDPVPAKQLNMLFGGTLVAYGRGTMIVTSVGDNTEMGKIAENLSQDDIETPLQVKLGDLGGKITKISGALAGLLFILMIVNMVMKNVLNIDAAGIIPFLESIEPVKTAFTEACETIGSVSVICSDKTGTLTQNRMTVEVVYNNGGYMDDAEKSGQGYFLENCLLNSTADIEDLDGTYKYIGSATECALLLYNKDEDYREYRNSSEIVSQKPFSSELKRMTTIIRENDDYILLSKGAPEIILNRCSYIQKENKVMELTSEVKNEILTWIIKE